MRRRHDRHEPADCVCFCKGMEPPPVAPMSRDAIPAIVQPRFRGVRSKQGEELVLQQNIFIEQSIVKGTMRPFTDGELTEYPRPFPEPGEDHRPMRPWPGRFPHRRRAS